MKKALFSSFAAPTLAVLALGLVATPVARAQHSVNPKSETVKKYIESDKFGHVKRITSAEYQMVMTTHGSSCKRNLLECPLGIAAIKGQADPKYKEIFKDLAKISKKGKNRTWLFGPFVASVWPIGVTLWNPDKALAIMTEKLQTLEVVDFIARGKQYIYDALWYLGNPAAFDAMFKWFHNLNYTGLHTRNALMRIHTWKLSGEQKKKVEGFCLKMFQNTGALPVGKKREKEIVKPCLRWLGLTGSKNSDAIEYAENYLGTNTAADAARALGGMNYKKAKGALKNILNKQKKQRKIKKKKVTIWHPRAESVAAAVALIGMGDKDAIKAIKSWIAVDKKAKRLKNNSGFEMTFYEAPWASAAAKKKLLPLLKKSFKAVNKLSKSNENIKRYAVRAAIALAQCGQKDGLKLMLEVLKGSKKDFRDEVLVGLGGHDNYWGSFRIGLGGLTVGVKKGIGKKEVAQLEKMIFKRLKFWSKRGVKERAMRAVLDMRTRVKAAGL
ncbi:MAG: hypothetical protein KAI47_10810 [Deltaproteobacteria bacterium]|nr:hypothetical protein [Deltaproteobacteria bacterium]